MSKEILVNITPQETRVAVIEQGVVQELHIERASSLGKVGKYIQWPCQAGVTRNAVCFY